MVLDLQHLDDPGQELCLRAQVVAFGANARQVLLLLAAVGLRGLEVEGPVSRERLSGPEWGRLEAELKRGPLAHGLTDDQRWTLGRIKTLIGRLFHKGYTVQGVAKPLKRHGWSCQVPVRHAIERDEEAIEMWKDEVWPRLKGPRRTWVPTSASRTRLARG
nr:winged helix-turn-helix domain-containing protein [Streptomyces sp. NBC_00899]